MGVLAFLIQALLNFSSNTLAANNETELVKAALISETISAPKDRGIIWVGLHQKLQPNWHTYWRYAGDSGLPTQLKWKKFKNVEIGKIHWPLPDIIKVGPLVNYGYENETLLLIPLTVKKKGPINLKAVAEWLVCREICIPQRKVLSLNLPAGNGEINPVNASLFKKFRRLVPEELHWPSKVFSIGNQIKLIITMNMDELKRIESVHVFPGIDGLIENGEIQKFSKNKRNIIINMKAGYAIEEGLKFFEGMINIKRSHNGSLDNRSYRIKKLPLLNR